jgi:hypothetical protein
MLFWAIICLHSQIKSVSVTSFTFPLQWLYSVDPSFLVLPLPLVESSGRVFTASYIGSARTIHRKHIAAQQRISCIVVRRIYQMDSLLLRNRCCGNSTFWSLLLKHFLRQWSVYVSLPRNCWPLTSNGHYTVRLSWRHGTIFNKAVACTT